MTLFTSCFALKRDVKTTYEHALSAIQSYHTGGYKTVQLNFIQHLLSLLANSAIKMRPPLAWHWALFK
jgi:hypothetical protein